MHSQSLYLVHSYLVKWWMFVYKLYFNVAGVVWCCCDTVLWLETLVNGETPTSRPSVTFGTRDQWDMFPNTTAAEGIY